jgi:hypothetical protein
MVHSRFFAQLRWGREHEGPPLENYFLTADEKDMFVNAVRAACNQNRDVAELWQQGLNRFRLQVA